MRFSKAVQDAVVGQLEDVFAVDDGRELQESVGVVVPDFRKGGRTQEGAGK